MYSDKFLKAMMDVKGSRAMLLSILSPIKKLLNNQTLSFGFQLFLVFRTLRNFSFSPY